MHMQQYFMVVGFPIEIYFIVDTIEHVGVACPPRGMDRCPVCIF